MTTSTTTSSEDLTRLSDTTLLEKFVTAGRVPVWERDDHQCRVYLTLRDEILRRMSETRS